nr:serine protease [uncultured Duganella sp.]
MIPANVTVIAAGLKHGLYECPQLCQLAEAAQLIADEIVASGALVTRDEILNVVKVLNSHRHFDHTHIVGNAWHATQGCDPRIQKHLAQALIELGGFEAADKLIDEAMEKAGVSNDAEFRVQVAEYQGLRGRIHKQKDVHSRDVNFLRDSTDAYSRQHALTGAFWHGVNVVALRLLESRRGLPERPGDSVEQVARSVLEKALEANRRNPLDPWPLATVSEISLALHDLVPSEGWCDQAELWLYRFLAHPSAGTFEVESYFRQLREVWMGNPLGGTNCADRLAGIIERHVLRTQRRWSVDARNVKQLVAHPEELERNFSGEKAFTVGDLRKMLDLCPNIGCVIDAAGMRMGTGFLMPGSVFGSPLNLLFVTNAHVISENVQGALLPADARVTFEIESIAAHQPTSHEIDKVLFTSEPEQVGRVLDKPDKLDVTIVSLKTLPTDVRGLPCASNIPLPAPTTKAFVVGHPKAGPLQFSVHDSLLLDICPYERLMHYRTPTEPGSSGSPVFNAKWEVVALHHAGSQTTPRLNGVGDYQANEGITLRSIRLAIEAGRQAVEIIW